ncbi:MAG TPA: tetratricopeptide repeat protein, partial [Actinomycetota bacterium]|nr:tetratricopeptide repeat protein [Actinomycetota bacterium]
ETSGSLGYALIMQGDPDAALPLVDEEIRIARALGDRFHEADGLGALAAIYFLQGDKARARDVSLEALALFRELNNLVAVSMMFESLAGWEGDRGAHERAARLWGAHLALRETTGGGAPPSTQIMGDPIPAAREALGDDAVDQLIEEGRAMDVEDAAAYAMSDGGE